MWGCRLSGAWGQVRIFETAPGSHQTVTDVHKSADSGFHRPDMFQLGLANAPSNARVLVGSLIRKGWWTHTDVEIISAMNTPRLLNSEQFHSFAKGYY